MVPPLLLVEDNPQDEKLIFRALRKANIVNAIDVVRDGQQALDYLFQEGEFAHLAGAQRPAVVLLDINLPKVNGLDVLLRLRGHEPTRLLPVVILTSSDDERDRLSGYSNGANSYVRKPIDLAEFVEAVASLGVYWAVTNDPPYRSGNPAGAVTT
jgi:DNA-binding response OmpR family regulator